MTRESRIVRAVMRHLIAACCALSMTVAQAASTIALTRLDCGNEPAPARVASFSDTYEFPDLALPLTYSCYLVRHGDVYLLWDTGVAVGSAPEAPKRSLVAQLQQLGLAPEQVRYVAISHYHYDHIGQVDAFANSTLFIGKGDWDGIAAASPPADASPEEFATLRRRFASWLNGKATVEPLSGDKDLFGDGSVVMLSLPGHTPGHHGLLVRLEKTGNVLLSGDVTHFRENYASNGVPRWNTDRADSLASLDRFRKLAEHLHATVIIQHDPRDIAKLPAFAAAAE